ncbi:MAG TPA: TonB-dependent receptor [Rhizomicrobium sp.]|nr:TonB-dependent receptor [Rhizomicrobium sp.]
MAGLLAVGPAMADVPSLEDLSKFSIEDLANLPVTSVSKQAQPLSDAPAAIYVIDADDIRRSGANTLPEILRLAPNLEVAQVSGSGYAITARGFNGTTTTNGAGNKLLVLIDGRTVYTPLYGGVFWDLQNVLPEDIDRIEVVSGPGAALWGANAVNGVINIITHSSADTQGLSARLDGGTLENQASVQYGGTLAPVATFRLYGQGYLRGGDPNDFGTDMRDAWNRLQGGFRVDWTPGDAQVTFQGDVFTGREGQALGPNAVIGGHNIMARWIQPLGQGTLQAQAYYDYNTLYLPGSLGDALHTYDLDLQHGFSLGESQEIVVGGGIRFLHDRFTNTATVKFLPAIEDLHIANAFVQDTVAVARDVSLVLGMKLEDDPFENVEPLPSARLSWRPSDTSMLWAAVSRAIRAPTLWDRDLTELAGGQTILGGGHFQSEKLIAYEAGYRAQPLANVSFSFSAFYNSYDDLRSIEFSSNPNFLVEYANEMEGETYGAEAWGSWRPYDWWTLSGGFSLLKEDLRFKPGSSTIGGLMTAGNDPTHQIFLRSAFDLPHGIELDIDARYVSVLPEPSVPAYLGLNARIGWHVTDAVELALTGTNLTGPHREFNSPLQGIVLQPEGLLTVTWKH